LRTGSAENVLTYKGGSEEVTGGWKYYIMRSFIICTLHQLLGWSNQGEWDWWDM